MQLPKKEDITIMQGSQFIKVINWYLDEVQDEIDAVTPGYPTIITAAAHGLPTASSTPIIIEGVKGTARDLNTSKCDRILATVIDPDSFSVPVSTRGKVYRTGTGTFTWNSPKDLTGWTAQMQIRQSYSDDTPLVSLTSGAGEIVINLADARITFAIPTSITETLDFIEGVYDLELISPTGEVTRLLEGGVTLSKEVTR